MPGAFWNGKIFEVVNGPGGTVNALRDSYLLPLHSINVDSIFMSYGTSRVPGCTRSDCV